MCGNKIAFGKIDKNGHQEVNYNVFYPLSLLSPSQITAIMMDKQCSVSRIYLMEESK